MCALINSFNLCLTELLLKETGGTIAISEQLALMKVTCSFEILPLSHDTVHCTTQKQSNCEKMVWP